MAAVDSNVRAIARANRAFLGRAVRFLAEAGGQPVPGHRLGHSDPGERARGRRGELPRRPGCVYADIDPVAIAHSKAILAVIRARPAHPGRPARPRPAILDHPVTRRLIDLDQPVGLLLVAVVHFLGDADEPWALVAALRDRLPPGSYRCSATPPARVGRR